MHDHQLHTAIGHRKRLAAAAARRLHRLVANARTAHHRQAARRHLVLWHPVDTRHMLDEVLQRRPIDRRQQRVQSTNVSDLFALRFRHKLLAIAERRLDVLQRDQRLLEFAKEQLHDAGNVVAVRLVVERPIVVGVDLEAQLLNGGMIAGRPIEADQLHVRRLTLQLGDALDQHLGHERQLLVHEHFVQVGVEAGLVCVRIENAMRLFNVQSIAFHLPYLARFFSV